MKSSSGQGKPMQASTRRSNVTGAVAMAFNGSCEEIGQNVAENRAEKLVQKMDVANCPGHRAERVRHACDRSRADASRANRDNNATKTVTRQSKRHHRVATFLTLSIGVK